MILQAQEEEINIEYESTNVTGNIFLLNDPEVPSADNVVVSAGVDGLFLVDTAFMETLNTVLPLVNNFGGPVKIVINTHFHHAGANSAFASSATIIAHKNVRERMQKKSLMYGQFPIGPWPEIALPDVILDSTLVLHFNGEEIRIFHIPNAHTDGDVVVFFTKSNVAVTGDIFVPSLGVCDFQNGGKWPAFLKSLDYLLKVIPEDAKIIPGHGPVSSYEDLKQVREMLYEVTGMVQQKINSGKNLETIKSDGLPNRWKLLAEKGLPTDFFLSNVHQGLTGKSR